MKIALTGATGHLGAALVRELLASGHAVRALVREDRRALEGLEIEAVEGDVTDPAPVAALCRGVDAVIHAAGRVSLEDHDDEVFRINLGGTRNVVEACLSAKVGRLVHVSSIHAFAQEPLDAPLDETRPLADPADRRLPPYDRSKAGADREVLRGIAAGLDAVVIHPSALVGPYDWKPSHFGQVVLRIAERRLPALIEGGFDWLDVRDAAAATVRAIGSGRRGERYLVAGRWAPVTEVAAIVANAAGVRPPRLVVPLWAAVAGLPFLAAWANLSGHRPVYTRAALQALRGPAVVRRDRAVRDLGLTWRPLEASLQDALAWFRR